MSTHENHLSSFNNLGHGNYNSPDILYSIMTSTKEINVTHINIILENNVVGITDATKETKMEELLNYAICLNHLPHKESSWSFEKALSCATKVPSPL